MLAETRDRNRAGCQALLSLIGNTIDTNMIRRGGFAVAREIARTVSELLREKGSLSTEEIEELDRQFIKLNLSPGGCADLLGITYLLHDLGTYSEENREEKEIAI